MVVVADNIDTTARAILACVCEALANNEAESDEDKNPVCACYATIGPPIVGGNCCECDIEDSDVKGVGEATIHFERLYDADPNTFEQVPRIHPCKRGFTVADFSINVTRCYPMFNEDGSTPDIEDQDGAATDMHADVQTVYKALTCGCTDYSLVVQEVAVGAMPEAGCSVLGARITVEVKA